MAKRGRSAAALRKLRQKYGLGEFKRKKAKRTTIRKRPIRKKRPAARRKRANRIFNDPQMQAEYNLDALEGRQR